MGDKFLEIEEVNGGFEVVEEIINTNPWLEITLLSQEHQPTVSSSDQSDIPIIDFTQLHEYLQEEEILKCPHVGYIPEIITPLMQTPFHIISWYDSKSASNHTLYAIFVPNENLEGGNIVVVKTDAWLCGQFVNGGSKNKPVDEYQPNSLGATRVLNEQFDFIMDTEDMTQRNYVKNQLQAIHNVSEKANKPKEPR